MKRSFEDLNNDFKNIKDKYEYENAGGYWTIRKREENIETTEVDPPLYDISNALDVMMDTKNKVERITTEDDSLEDLMSPIVGITTTEPPVTISNNLAIDEDFSEIQDVEKSLDTILPLYTETTIASYLLTEIPQISEKPYEVVTTLEDLLASVPQETSHKRPITHTTKLGHPDNIDTNNEMEESKEGDEYYEYGSTYDMKGGKKGKFANPHPTTVPSMMTCEDSDTRYETKGSYEYEEYEEAETTKENFVKKCRKKGKHANQHRATTCGTKYKTKDSGEYDENQETENIREKRKHQMKRKFTNSSTEKEAKTSTRHERVLYPLEIETMQPGNEYEDSVSSTGNMIEGDFSMNSVEDQWPRKPLETSDEEQIELMKNIENPLHFDIKNIMEGSGKGEEEDTDDMFLLCSTKGKLTNYFHKTSEKSFTKQDAESSTSQEQFLYPIEIEKLHCKEEDENSVSSTETTIKSAMFTATVQSKTTKKDKKIINDKKEYDSDYYVDIVFPSDTEEQQHYLDRLVKREEPFNDYFTKYPRRTRREDADRHVWKEFKWPEHRKYIGSDIGSLTSTQKNIEMLTAEQETSSRLESTARRKSGDRQIWKEFKWPEHRKYVSSDINSLTSTQTNIEMPTEEQKTRSRLESTSKGKSGDRQIWKEFKWPEYRKYGDVGRDRSLTSTEKEIEALSNIDVESLVPTTELTKGKFDRNQEKKGLFIEEEGSLISTEKEIEVLTNKKYEDNNIWEEFNWPAHKEYTSSGLGSSSSERLPPDQDFDTKVISSNGATTQEDLGTKMGIWERFRWPENKNVGTKVSPLTEEKTQTTVGGRNGNIWQQFRWPSYKNYGAKGVSSTMKTSGFSSMNTERNGNIWKQFRWPQHKSYDSIMSTTTSQDFPVLGTEIASRDGMRDYESEAETPFVSEWSTRSKIPGEIGQEAEIGNTEESLAYANFPRKHKILVPEDTPMNMIPMGELEELEASSKRFDDENLEETKSEAEKLEKINWSIGTNSPFSDEKTAGPYVIKTALWDKLHLPFHKTAHMKVIPASASSENERATLGTLERSTEEIKIWNRFRWPDHKNFTTSGVRDNKENESGILRKFNWPNHQKYLESSSTKEPLDTKPKIWEELMRATPSGIESSSQTPGAEGEEEILKKTVNDKEHTTKIIEKYFNPEELSSKNYILEDTDLQTTTDVWEAFRWPPPRLHVSKELSTEDSMENLKKVTPASMWPPYGVPDKVESSIDEQLENPEKSVDLFALPGRDMDTNNTNFSYSEVPVPPFPPLEEYDDYALLSTSPAVSNMPLQEKYYPGEMELFTDQNLPLSRNMESKEKNEFADSFEPFSLSSNELYSSPQHVPVDDEQPLYEFTSDFEQVNPFWGHPNKKLHYPKTTSTDGFPSKVTSPPTQSTTIGELLELAEEMNFKEHHEVNTEATFHGPIKVPQQRTLHTPVRESEDDDNLWDFRVLSEEEVVTFHPKTRKPTQKKTTIYSFKPVGTTADDWEIFNESPREEITKHSSDSASTEKQTTFYVLITKPPEPLEPLEIDEEKEDTVMLEPPPTMAPPGTVEHSTDYYDEEGGITLEGHEVEAETFQEAKSSETVTFRVSEISVGSTESYKASSEEAGFKEDENVELVTFRSFETYPTAPGFSQSEPIGEMMENVRKQNDKESLIDSLELELVTFRKPKPVAKTSGPPSIIEFHSPNSENSTLETLPTILPEGVSREEKDNLLYALTDSSNVPLELPERAKIAELGEGTTKIIEGDMIITESYDHRSMSIPFNEKLGGAPDIIEEINKPDDSNEMPPLPPMSDLGADFIREQSDFGRIRDPYSVIERPLEKENTGEKELMLMEGNLKSPFTEENLEEDFATALMEPEHLELGETRDDSWEKTKYLLETLERPSVLENLKKKLTNFRAKPITAGGGSENDGERGREFYLEEKSATVGDLLGINFTYPEAVEAVIAIERTTEISVAGLGEDAFEKLEDIIKNGITYPEAVEAVVAYEPTSESTSPNVSKHDEPSTQSVEKNATSRHKVGDKLEDMIDLENQLEKSELTENPVEDITTIPDLLTPLQEISRIMRTSTEKEGSSFIPVHNKIEESVPSEVPTELTSPIDELLTEFLVPEISIGSVNLSPEIMITESKAVTSMAKTSGSSEGENKILHHSESSPGLEDFASSTIHVSAATAENKEDITLMEIQTIMKLEGGSEKSEFAEGKSSTSTEEEEALTEGPSELVEEIVRTLDDFEVSPEFFTGSVEEKALGKPTLGIDVLSIALDMSEKAIHEESTSEMHIPDLLTPIIMNEEEQVPATTFPITSEEILTESKISTVESPTTFLSDEELSLVTPFLIHEYNTSEYDHSLHETTEKHSKTKMENIQQNMPMREEQQEIEQNLAHLPKDKHETSTVCQICNETQTIGSGISTSQHRGGYSEETSESKVPVTFVGYKNEEKDREVLYPLHTSRTPTSRVESTTHIETEEEEFDTNLIHMPERDHETSTICEICGKESETKIPEFSEIHSDATRTTQNFKYLEEEHTEFSETNSAPIVTSTEERKHEEGLEELDSNLHHLRDQHLHETSTICEICTDEAQNVPYSTSIEKERTLKSHLIPEKNSQTTVKIETTPMLTPNEVMEEEELENNLHHLPEHHLKSHETSTICEICTEDKEGIPQHPSLSIGETEIITKIPGITSASKEDSETNMNEYVLTSSAEEGGKSTELEIGHIAEASSAGGIIFETESYTSNSERNEFEGTEGTTGMHGTHVEVLHSPTEKLEDVKNGLTYNFEGKEINQPMHITTKNVFKMGEYTSTTVESISSISPRNFTIEEEAVGEKSEFTIEEVETTEIIEEPTSGIYSTFGESTIDEGLKAVEDIEEKLKMMKTEKTSEGTETNQMKINLSTGAERETTETPGSSEDQGENVITSEKSHRENIHTRVPEGSNTASTEITEMNIEMPASTNFYTEFGSTIHGEISTYEEGTTQHINTSLQHVEESTEGIVRILQELEIIGEESKTRTEGYYELTTQAGRNTSSSKSENLTVPEEHAGIKTTEMGIEDLEERGTTSIETEVSALLKNLEEIQEELFISTLGIIENTEVEHEVTGYHTSEFKAMISGENEIFSTTEKENISSGTAWNETLEVEQGHHTSDEFELTGKENSEVADKITSSGVSFTLPSHEPTGSEKSEILEDEVFTDFYTEIKSKSTPFGGTSFTEIHYPRESSVELVTSSESSAFGGTSFTETHTPRESSVGPVSSSESYLSEKIEKTLEKLNDAANELLMTTPEHDLFGKNNITESFILDKELEDLNREFEEMLKITIPAKDLLRNSEHTVEELVTSTEELFSIVSLKESTENKIDENPTTVSEASSEAIEEETKIGLHRSLSEETTTSTFHERTITTPVISTETQKEEGTKIAEHYFSVSIKETQNTHFEGTTSEEEDHRGETAKSTYEEKTSEKISSLGFDQATEESEEVARTDFYTEVNNTPFSSRAEEKFEKHKAFEAGSPTNEESSSIPVWSDEKILSGGVEDELKDLDEIKIHVEAISSTIKAISKGASPPGEETTENNVLGEELKNLFEESSEKYEMSSKSSSVEEIMKSSVTESVGTGIGNKAVTTAFTQSEDHTINILSDVIDRKFNEIDEVVQEILTTSPSSEEYTERVMKSEEKITESDILKEKLGELVGEFEEILETTLSDEEILDHLVEKFPSAGKQTEERPYISTEHKVGGGKTTLQITSSSVEADHSTTSVVLTAENTKLSVGESEILTRFSEKSEIPLAERNESEHRTLAYTEFTEGRTNTLEGQTKIFMGTEFTESSTGELTGEMKGKTFFPTMITTETEPKGLSSHSTPLSGGDVTVSYASTGIISGTSAMEEEITDFHTTEESIQSLVSSRKSVTDKLEGKLGELDEIINEFLTSTPIPEALAEGTRGREGENNEGEVIEKELEDLKHEFQLILSTTIAPEYLLEAVEDVLAPTTTSEIEEEISSTMIGSTHSEIPQESTTSGESELSSSILHSEENKSTAVIESEIGHDTNIVTTSSESELFSAILYSEENKSTTVTESEAGHDTSLSGGVTISHASTGIISGKEEKITDIYTTEESIAPPVSSVKSVTDKLEEKLGELDEIINNFLTSTPTLEALAEGTRGSEEENTEEEAIEKELEDLEHEFELMLSTTIAPEYLLEAVEDVLAPTTTNEIEVEITSTLIESTRSEIPQGYTTNGEREASSSILHSEENKSSTVIVSEIGHDTNMTTTSSEGGASSAILPSEENKSTTIMESEIGHDTSLSGGVTISRASTGIILGISGIEEKITDIYTTEESMEPPVSSVKSATDKLEEKFGKLDEIINDFLTSTPTLEALAEGTRGSEEEAIENELEDLEHEFQLMLSTTIAPEYLLEAVEDVLAPTTTNEIEVEITSTLIESTRPEIPQGYTTNGEREASLSLLLSEENISSTVIESEIGHDTNMTTTSSEGEASSAILPSEENKSTTIMESEIGYDTGTSREHPERNEIYSTTNITEKYEETVSANMKVVESETTAEPTRNKTLEEEEFESNLLHLPEHHMKSHETSTICEICSKEEEGNVTHPPFVSKTGTIISPAHEFKSSRSPGESDKGHETGLGDHNGTSGSTLEQTTEETGHSEREEASTNFTGGSSGGETSLPSKTIEGEEHVESVSEGSKRKTSSGGLEKEHFANSPGIQTEAYGGTASEMSKIGSETAKTGTYSSKSVTEPQGKVFTKPEEYSSRYSERTEKVSETPSSKMHTTEGLSSISLLTTLLLSLVTSTTQSPEKNNSVPSHFASNISGPQNIPKCLVVFITGESPLLPMNGTKWVPSECPRLGEASTSPHAVEQTTSSKLTTGITDISTSLGSTVAVSETTTSNTNETSSSTTELTTTTLVPVEELPEIISNNFVEGGCSETDFEDNNKCFCMLDLTVDHVAEDLGAVNSSKTYTAKCSKFLKVNQGLVMRNETPAALKRSRRSYLYLKYLNRQKRETVEYNKIDEVLANELTASSNDTTIYTDVGGIATVPCFYKDEVIEREHFMKYVWSSEDDKTIIFSDRVREGTDGALKISEVSVEDGGNYTCSINRPFGNTDTEHKRFVHELLVIAKPIFKVKATIMYETDEPCSLKDGDVVHAYLPKMLEDLLCGIHKRVCKVEMERPSCVEVENKTYLSVKYIVTLDDVSSLLPSISNSECDFNCQMKLMGSLVSLLIKNVETSSVLDVISEIQSFNHTFKPREVKFPTDRSAVEDLTLLPKLVIGCPSGFGIQKSTSKICVACPRNTYNSENSSACSSCPRDHYQPKIGSTSCIECKTPFDDKACVGMMFANKAFFILYVGSSVTIVFLILLCIFCAQNSTQTSFEGPHRKKKPQTPKRRRMGRKDVEDPAEKPLLPKDPSVPRIVRGPKLPPPDF